MIKTTNSIETPEWGSGLPSPVITVKHSMDSLEITELVRVAVETGYIKAVLEGLPEDYFMDARDNYYMVSKDGGQAPEHVHLRKSKDYKSAFESAYEEAKRLAKKEPGLYRVLRIVRTIRSQAVTKTEIVIQEG